MAKYCPSCGSKNNDLLLSCWNCGQWIGRGSIEELRTPIAAQKVQTDLNLEKREVTSSKPYIKKEETNVGLVTIYGVTRKDLDDLLKKNNVIVEHTEMPGLCKQDEMLTQAELRRGQQPTNSGVSNTYSGSSSSYYYNDPVDDFCCYYGCYPRSRYSSRSSSTVCCVSSSSSSNSDCDCNDSGGESDAFAAIIVILLVVAIFSLLVFMGPSLIGVGIVIIDLAMGAILVLFNILTLAIYKDDLSRHRIKIKYAEQDDLNAFLLDLVHKRGVPRMHGYWTQGFIMIRYGAIFLMAGIAVLVTMLFMDLTTQKLFIIPTAMIGLSLLTFIMGHVLINRKISELKVNLKSEMS
jgi:hypothetical protein